SPTFVGTRFHGTTASMSIWQVYGDSTKTSWMALGGPFDLIFIDACHEYDYVKRDSASALEAVRPGGLILWHDYGVVEGVSRAVDEAVPTAVVLLGTSLACVRK